MTSKSYVRTADAVVHIAASPELIFAHLDDQTHLGGHMEKPSMMMMGGYMTYAFDQTGGRAAGSVIKMGGHFLGLDLSVEEVVTVHAPPRMKVWETQGQPHLLIIGAYRMGFELTPSDAGSRLRVFIEYDPLTTFAGRILSFLFAPIYARWCVGQMARDAERHFRLSPAKTAAKA